MGVTADQALTSHGPAMRALLGRLVGDALEAEEAYRDACVRVVRFMDRRRGDDGSLRAWMLTVARHEGYRRLRRRAAERRVTRRLVTGESERLAAPGPGPSTGLRERQLDTRARELLFDLISELRPHESALIALRFRDGLSHREIGTRLGAPEGPLPEATVRKRLSRVVGKLRARAEEAGLGELVVR